MKTKTMHGKRLIWGAVLLVTLFGRSLCAEDVVSVPSQVAAIPVVEDKVSFDLKGIDITELLKILSMKMNVNIVPTKDVTGRVNVYLNNVTLQDAFDIILASNSLAAVKDSNIITVMPLDKYVQLYGRRYKDSRQVRTFSLKHAAPTVILNTLSQIKTDTGKIIIDESTGTVILMDVPEAVDLMEETARALDHPKETEIFTLKYAKAEDLKGQISALLTPGVSEIQVDERTNKILISDLPDRLKKIKSMIDEFDSETREVLIEAQIVQIALNDQTQFGIDWEKIFENYRDLALVGKFPLSGMGNYGQLTYGTLAADGFTVVLQALNTITKTKILSRPRIAVVNNKEASILIGTKEVYFSQTQSQSSVTTTTAEVINYVDVGVKLNVTPTITDDDFIIMKVRPEVSSVRETATSPLGSRVPVVETSQAETVVKVKDRAMVMIAGLMKEEDRSTRNQIPFLGKIPILGWAFRNTDDEQSKTELAIFLTPRIITGDIERPDVVAEQVKTSGVLTKRPLDRME